MSRNAPCFNGLNGRGNGGYLIRPGNSSLRRKDFLLKTYRNRCRAILPCDPKFFLLPAEIRVGSSHHEQQELQPSRWGTFFGWKQTMALAVGVAYFLWDRAGTVGSRWYCGIALVLSIRAV